MELEQGKNVDFWRDMTTITEDEISKLRKLEASGKGPGTEALLTDWDSPSVSTIHRISPPSRSSLTSHFLCVLGSIPLYPSPGDRREGINTSVTIDVQTVFKGKTYSQLQALHLNIETKIRAGGSNLDIGYWESLMQQVRVYMSRAK